MNESRLNESSEVIQLLRAFQRLQKISDKYGFTPEEVADVERLIAMVATSVMKSEKADLFGGSVRRAANGRRLLGASNRERVRVAAEKYRGMKKEAAANEIAAELGRGAGTVLRDLTLLFPGDAWKKR